ncbi:MAG: tetratricopeptide repeat protein [Alphaproteobacteria bacterium]|jgi:tetratricopeptide (TPR) repeat protein|nr:tetratricopeptide repeat protein [Alphaproteobacteria bacterium]MBT7942385.1 tetratricopeptide repeat protein [Alphaproteobacteria bacterium]
MNPPGENLRGLIESGIKQIQAGQFGVAEKTLSSVLKQTPNDPGVLHLLGLSRHLSGNHAGAIAPIQQAVALVPSNDSFLNSLGQAHQALGEHNEALDCFSKAVAINPADAGTHLNLGNALKALERFDDALVSYRAALNIHPDFPEAHFNLALVLQAQGDLEGALAGFRQTLALKPDFPQALCEMGNTLKDLGQREEASACYLQFIKLAPNMVHPETHVTLGDLLGGLDRHDEAVDQYDQALRKNPQFVGAYINRGNTLRDLQRLEEATASYTQARDLDPDLCEPYIGLGNILKDQNRLEDAIEYYRQAIQANPNSASAFDNLGSALKLQGKLEDAVGCYRDALRFEPENAKVHHNLGMVYLLMGRLREGWAEYHWRWRIDASEEPRAFPHPSWQGEDLKNKTILVWSEQGVGDEVMFASMIPDLLDAGAQVVLESYSRMIPLYQRSFPGVTCVAKGTPASTEAYNGAIVDFHLPFGDLGGWLRNDFESFPNRRSYLVADQARRDILRGRYQDGNGNEDFLIGIAWHSMNESFGDQKSLALHELKPLADVPGVKLVDLQYGDTAGERTAFLSDHGHSIIHDDDIDQMQDLDAFAAQVAALDLVVTISNTTAHFAGALGIPAWVMLNTAPLTCWMLDRDDSPWYPSVKLFRQTRPGDWTSVILRVVQELGTVRNA